MNQEQKVVQHLRSVGSISGLEASDLYRIRDLPKRISEINAYPGAYGLRHGEWIKKDRRRDHLQQIYMRYSLVDAYAGEGMTATVVP